MLTLLSTTFRGCKGQKYFTKDTLESSKHLEPNQARATGDSIPTHPRPYLRDKPAGVTCKPKQVRI